MSRNNSSSINKKKNTVPKPEIALEVKHVSKSFRLPIEQSNGIKQAFVNWTRGIKGYKEQKVLKDISFKVEKGDFFGIVGRNGSGKSTLLKLISQIYTPDKGQIKVNGKLVPFIELGVGFNPELTGRENVYLNGALLGFSHEEVSAMYEEIVEFAELEEFMDQKLKNYSSGMQVRLAFSIAIKAQGDILVLDEVLAVGDEAFQRKCFNYFAKLKKEKRTVILVTHSMDQVQQFCDKVLLIDKTHKPMIGTPGEISRIYRELNSPKKTEEVDQYRSDSVSVEADYKEDQESVVINVKYSSQRDLNDVVLTAIIMRDSGEWIYRWASDEKIDGQINLIKGQEYRLKLELQKIFCDGIFNVEFAILPKNNRKERYIQVDDMLTFEIINRNMFTSDKFWKPTEEYELTELR